MFAQCYKPHPNSQQVSSTELKIEFCIKHWNANQLHRINNCIAKVCYEWTMRTVSICPYFTLVVVASYRPITNKAEEITAQEEKWNALKVYGKVKHKTAVCAEWTKISMWKNEIQESIKLIHVYIFSKSSVCHFCVEILRYPTRIAVFSQEKHKKIKCKKKKFRKPELGQKVEQKLANHFY